VPVVAIFRQKRIDSHEESGYLFSGSAAQASLQELTMRGKGAGLARLHRPDHPGISSMVDLRLQGVTTFYEFFILIIYNSSFT